MDIATYKDISKRIKSNIKIPLCDYEDLIHDTLVKLIERDIKDETDCKKMCVIVALNILRDNKRKENSFLKYAANTPINYTEQPEYIKELKEPVKYKEYYILRYKLGLKYKEIAKYFGVSINSVGQKILQMRKEFKEINKLWAQKAQFI